MDTRQDGVRLSELNKLVHTARSVHPELLLLDLAILLCVARNPGCSQAFVRDRVEASTSAVSRAVHRLSEWERPRKPGLDLLKSEVDPAHNSFRMLFPTPKGVQLLRDMDHAMR